MIKNNQKLLNTFHVIIDALVIIFSYVAAWYIRFRSGIFEMAPWYLSIQEYMRVLVFLVPEYLILYYIFQLYTPKRVQGRRLEAWRIIQANVIGLMTFILLLYLARESDFSRTMMFVFFCVNVFVEVVGRNILREELRNIRKKGYNQKHILLVGYSRAAEQYIDRIRANPEWGYIVRGILADNKPRGTEYRGVKVLGRTENLSIVLPENKLDEIVITLGLAEYHKLEHIVGMCDPGLQQYHPHKALHRGFNRASGGEHPACPAEQCAERASQAGGRPVRSRDSDYFVFTGDGCDGGCD